MIVTSILPLNNTSFEKTTLLKPSIIESIVKLRGTIFFHNSKKFQENPERSKKNVEKFQKIQKKCPIIPEYSTKIKKLSENVY